MNVMLSKTFFPQHHRAGEPTGFADKVIKGTKRHTCRCNFEFWKQRIAQLKQRDGVLSLRQWSGKPYEKGSHQEHILDVGSAIVEVQELRMTRTMTGAAFQFTAEVEGTPVQVETLAANDGLSKTDFEAWFSPVFDSYAKETTPEGAEEPAAITLKFAVIQFSTFRY